MYYEPDEFRHQAKQLKDSLSFYHLNCRGLSANWESFYSHLCDLHGDNFSFDFIGFSELYRCDNDSRLCLPGYHALISLCRDDGPRGGVGLFMKNDLNYKIREDISVFIPHVFESLFVEIINTKERNMIVGVIYRPNTEPRADLDIFSSNMETIMDTINNNNMSSLIMGDMNVDILTFQNHRRTNEYLDGIFSHGFLPVITRPTRICSTSATLIDHMYTNDITSSYHSGITINDVADHFGTFCIFHSKGKQIKHNTPMRRSFRPNNVDKFNNILLETNFDHILYLDCPNAAYNEFLKLYMLAFEESFPLRSLNVTTKYVKRVPWFSSGLLNSSIKKAQLLSLKLHEPTEDNIKKYKQYNNLFNLLKKKMKILYFRTLLEENKTNSKKCWSILKQAIGKMNDKSSYPQSFLINNSMKSDKIEIAEGFNKFFANIGTQTSHNVPPSNTSFSSFMPNALAHSFFLGPVAPSDVLNITKKFKPKTSSGHDSISNKLLKTTIENIIEPLTHIINQCLVKGIVPNEMKIAKVLPIHKSSDSSI